MKSRTMLVILTGTIAIVGLLLVSALASSHREAPGIARLPQVDGTDFYMFRGYEDGRGDFVTIIANYNPLQDPFGGPNYYPLDSDALYDIHITNDGDAVEDLTFRFQILETRRHEGGFLAILVGPPDNRRPVAIPFINVAPFGVDDTRLRTNVKREYYTRVIRGELDDPGRELGFVTEAGNGAAKFGMPLDYIGEKSVPDYDAYAAQFIYDIEIPGCTPDGRMFVGQRQESFQVNLGEIFDLVNLDPLGATDGETSATANKNITTIALELPISCVTAGNGTIIGGWTTSRLPRTRELRGDNATFDEPEDNSGGFVQVSRLANPLVNELVIGMTKKNLFNGSRPRDDVQFARYVTNPTLPELLEILFGDAGVTAPNVFPRTDLVQVFLTGVPGLNQDGSNGEIMRLNTATPPVPSFAQNNLGVIAGDLAGYPNGRRPGDDVVDISLRVLMGVLLSPAEAPSGQLPFTDGARQHADQFDDTFPYLKSPIPGSPTE